MPTSTLVAESFDQAHNAVIAISSGIPIWLSTIVFLAVNAEVPLWLFVLTSIVMPFSIFAIGKSADIYFKYFYKGRGDKDDSKGDGDSD